MKRLRVLVGCEFSQIVTKAFLVRGHEAFSCDLLPTEGNPKWHIQDDVFDHLDEGWDMMIFHWPCTNMAVSGARWFYLKVKEQENDIKAFIKLMECEVPKVCGENPIGVLSTRYRKPDQIIQPWMFGHGETKATCLWLKNLPLLVPTDIVSGREHRIHRMAPGPNRSRERGKTYQGVANAMSEQWSNIKCILDI